jgi:hypothetical protein
MERPDRVVAFAIIRAACVGAGISVVNKQGKPGSRADKASLIVEWCGSDRLEVSRCEPAWW